MNKLEQDIVHHYDDYTNVFHEIVSWGENQGVDFLINFAVALVVLLIGWFVSRQVHQSVSGIPKALEVVRAAIASVPGVLKNPAPEVWCTELADSSVVLTVWPWAKMEDYWTVWKTSYPVIKQALDDNGIKIPFPQLDVHLDKETLPRG